MLSVKDILVLQMQIKWVVISDGHIQHAGDVWV